MQTLTRNQVQERIAGGEAVLAEALPPLYYAQGHLPGAVNLPHDAVDELGPELLPDKTREIVVYCADENCPNSSLAAQRLVELGYRNVAVYRAGKHDWSSAGLELETADAEEVGR